MTALPFAQESTLPEFLLDRIEEDRDQASSGWSRYPDGRWSRTDEGQSVLSPAAILAECEAKRRIVMLWSEEWDDWHGRGSGLVRMRMTDDQYLRVLDAERVLGALAQPYADHADYDPRWAAV